MAKDEPPDSGGQHDNKTDKNGHEGRKPGPLSDPSKGTGKHGK